MGQVDLNFVVNTGLIVFLATYLLVNGFLIFLLSRFRNAIGILAHSREHSSVPSRPGELSELKPSIIEIHRISARELNEINELKQSLFDIQNTAARQLNEIVKLRQSLADTSAGVTSFGGRAPSRRVT